MVTPFPVKNFDLTHLTTEALAILKRVYKTWSPCLRQVLEYNPREKRIKCLMHLPHGDYCYTKRRPPNITCIQHEHGLAQLCLFFFYFLVRDGVVDLWKEFSEKDVEFFVKNFLSWHEKRQLKKINEKEVNYFLSVKMAEVLINFYALFDEKQVIQFKRKLKFDEDYILEARLIRQYYSKRSRGKIPGLIFRVEGKNCQGKSALLVKIYNVAQITILQSPKSAVQKQLE